MPTLAKVLGACFLVCALAVVPNRAMAQAYPLIRSLDPEDPVYTQFQEDLAQAYGWEAKRPRRGQPRMALYCLRLAQATQLIALAARLNLPYETIASVNGMNEPGMLTAGTVLTLPAVPGLFVPKDPKNEMEKLMASWRKGDTDSPGIELALAPGGRQGTFYPGERFHPSERAFFLSGKYCFPLPSGSISSRYGYRIQPFTGKLGMHSGIDIQAAMGTEVFAARDGTVIFAGWDDTLGNHIVLDHGGDWTSVYGHLSKISVSLNQKVKKGSIIALVGSTGKSTGPHLHFEIRSGGKALNPESLLPRAPR